MKNIFKSLKEFASRSFEAIAIARTREALNHLPDHELKALGITRQQLTTGNFYSVNKILDFKSNDIGIDSKIKHHGNQKAA